MKYYETKREAEDAADANNDLIGQQMLKPYESYPITSITVEKNPCGLGFIVVLSHDVFDGGWPETTNFRCPQVELNDYLDVVVPPYL